MRSEKNTIVNGIGQMIADSDYVYFVSFAGMSVKEMTKFRNELIKISADCTVLKNSLIRKAAELNNIQSLAQYLMTGDTALISGKGDAGAVAKVIKDFNKSNDKLAAKGGYLDGELLNVADVDYIASIPPKPILQAQLLGVLQAPARNLACVLNAKAATIVNVLNNYQEKLDQ
ncbi:MAG: 50S ribosomal protein L10 [Victivallales bacterium]|nr:50S ribosomal protein L10 [Victivallales bacterium]